MTDNIRARYSTKKSSNMTYISDNQPRRTKLFPLVLAIIVFSLPLETLLPHYLGIRSHVYYLSILAIVLAALYLKEIIHKLTRAKGLLVVILCFSWTSFLYFLNPIRPNTEPSLLGQQILFCILLLYIADDQTWRVRLAWLFWAGWFLLCILSFQQYLSGNVSQIYYSRLDIERVIGVLSFSAAQHGAQIVTGLMLALVMYNSANHKKSIKFLLFISIILGAFVALMTASRVAVFSFLFILIIYFLFEVGRVKSNFIKTNLVPIFLLLSVIFLFFTQTAIGARLFDPFMVRFNMAIFSGDTTGRSDLALAAIELFRDNPIIGIGQGNSVQAIIPYSLNHASGVDIHNYYLKVLVEGGVVGAGLLLVGLILIVRQGWHWYQLSGEGIYFYPLLVLLIINLGGRAFHYKLFWFFLALNVIVPYISALGIQSPTKTDNEYIKHR